MTLEETIEISMKIILHAGNARSDIHLALDKIAEDEFESAEELLIKAKEKTTLAHQIHTEVIQQEASGETMQYSILFAHAQDTLMTIMSELALAKQLIKLFKHVAKKMDDK